MVLPQKKKLSKLMVKNKKPWLSGIFLFNFRNKYDNVVYITENDNFGNVKVLKVYPCTYQEQLETLQTFKLTPS